MLDKIQKDFDKKTPKEKIEILDKMIEKNTKKIKFREEFIRFSPLWCKFHLLIPVITLVGTVASFIIPIPRLIESLYSYILYAWVYSIAIVGTCSIIIPTRLVMSKTLKNLKNKTEDMKEIKEQLSLPKPNTETITESKDNSKLKEDILFQDYQPLHITEETRRKLLEHPKKYMSCDVRIRMGKFYTDEEKERYIEESISRPLPGGDQKGPTLVKKRILPRNTGNK